MRSLLTHSPVGSYHQLSPKHLPAYLDEFTFRYNNRRNDHLFRDTLMKLVGAENLTYLELVADSAWTLRPHPQTESSLGHPTSS